MWGLGSGNYVKPYVVVRELNAWNRIYLVLEYKHKHGWVYKGVNVIRRFVIIHM